MSIQSMTGFGEAERNVAGLGIRVELRSVNNRFLDANIKLPQAYSRLEAEISREIKAGLKRGRVDVYITRTEETSFSEEVTFRTEAFDRYFAIAKEAFSRAGLKGKDVIVSAVVDILRRKEVVDSKSSQSVLDDEEEIELLKQTVRDALKKLNEMRAQEGKALYRDIVSQLDEFEKLVEKIRSFSRDWTPIFHEKLKQRLERLGSGVEIDPSRLAQEVALLADRVDVTEELVRLESHISQFRSVLANAEGGKKMEFLLQEMGREINTTGSKSQSADISALIVEAKSILEKIREQVLNVE